MSYIGREPQIGNFQMCDAISVVNGQASYTMQVGGVAVIAGGNFNVIASVNGVVQKAGTSFTISSSTITFSQNLVTGDVIDFILILGSVLDLGVPSDGTVTTGKIADNAVTSAKLASGLALGKIGQVVYGTTSSSVTTTSSSFGDSNLTASITPSSTNSKILVIVNLFFKLYGNSTSTGAEGNVRLVRTIGSSATNLYTTNNNPRFNIWGNNTGFQMDTWVRTHRDSASTTSECNYKIQIASQSGAFLAQADGEESQIVLMEVLA